MKLGFVGLGTMGRPMAMHLLAAGHEVHAYDVVALPTEISDRVTQVHPTAESVARASEVVILMVPDTPHVEAALFSDSGVAAGLSAGKLVIDMSSISPIATKGYAQRINALGCDYLDAPVSGGEVGAKAASLTIMVGGPEAAFQRALPLLQKMGRNITRVGGNGDGQTCKVANQIIVALTIEAVAEALLFAAKAGANPARVREALMGGFASSRILELHGQRMIDRAFEPGFRIHLHQKDLKLALSSAQQLGLSLPNTASTQELFTACVARGGAAEDHSALVKALETLANFELPGHVAAPAVA